MPSNDVTSPKRKGISTLCILNVHLFLDIQQSLIRSLCCIFIFYLLYFFITSMNYLLLELTTAR